MLSRRRNARVTPSHSGRRRSHAASPSHRRMQDDGRNGRGGWGVGERAIARGEWVGEGGVVVRDPHARKATAGAASAAAPRATVSRGSDPWKHPAVTSGRSWVKRVHGASRGAGAGGGRPSDPGVVPSPIRQLKIPARSSGARSWHTGRSGYSHVSRQEAEAEVAAAVAKAMSVVSSRQSVAGGRATPHSAASAEASAQPQRRRRHGQKKDEVQVPGRFWRPDTSKSEAMRRSASSTLGRTQHSTMVRVVKGELYAVPFKASKKAFLRRRNPSEAYGSHNPVLNRGPRVSEAKTAFKKRRPQSAGCTRKLPVPYSHLAGRNRLEPRFGSQTKFNQSGINLAIESMAAKDTQPFKTVYQGAMGPSARGPVYTRPGFTNPGILAAQTRWDHKHVLD